MRYDLDIGWSKKDTDVQMSGSLYYCISQAVSNALCQETLQSMVKHRPRDLMRSPFQVSHDLVSATRSDPR